GGRAVARGWGGRVPGPAARTRTDPDRRRALVPRLRAICGEDGVVTAASRRRTYESDGLTYHAEVPGVVVLPRTAEQVAAVLRLCSEEGVPFVPRGAGTGLSAGALPRA